MLKGLAKSGYEPNEYSAKSIVASVNNTIVYFTTIVCPVELVLLAKSWM